MAQIVEEKGNMSPQSEKAMALQGHWASPTGSPNESAESLEW